MNDNNTSNTKLQDFVTTTAALGRITFGDVRRLERDYLPGGITTCDEVELLIGLDGAVSRADRAWAPWLITAISSFAIRCDQSVDAGDLRERLKAVLAGAPSRAVRKIGREIGSQVERPAEPVCPEPAPQTLAFPAKTDSAPPVRKEIVSALAVLPVAIWNSTNRLKMAA